MKPRTRTAFVVIVLLVGWFLAVPFRKPAHPVSSDTSRNSPELNIRHQASVTTSRPIAAPIKLTPDNTAWIRPRMRREFDNASHRAPIGELSPAASAPAPEQFLVPVAQPTPSPRRHDEIVDEAEVHGAKSEQIEKKQPTDIPSSHQRWHRVVNGDSLPRLAETYLGNKDHYLLIFEANRDVLASPSVLPIGVELRIPRAAEVGSATPPAGLNWKP